MGTGDQSGTWGTTTNTNLGTAIDQAIAGTVDVTFSSADVTLTLTSSNSSQSARNLRLNLIGTSGGSRNLIIPASFTKYYIILNGLADVVTVQNPTGSATYSIPAGRVAQVYCTGTGVYPAIDYLSGAILSSAAAILGGSINGTPIGAVSPSTGAFTTLSTTSAITYGGVTLSNAVTGTGNMVLSASPALTGSPTAPTQSSSDNSTNIATTAFVTTKVGTLGTMASQNANNVAITGGTWTTGGSINSISVTTIGSNSTGTKTISTSAPSGGVNGDVWYQI